MFQRQLMEEIFVVVYHGKAGSEAEVSRMPVYRRRWWFDRVQKEHDEERKKHETPQGHHVEGATFPQPGKGPT